MLSEVILREYLEAQGTLAREDGSAQGILRRELISAQGTLAHGHVSARGILARGHVSGRERAARVDLCAHLRARARWYVDSWYFVRLIVFKVCYSRNQVPFYLWQVESVLNTATVLNTSTAIFAIDFYRVGKHIGWGLFWYMLLVFYRIVS